MYTRVCRIIGEMCYHVGIPLTPFEMSRLLGGVVDEELVEVVCENMCEEGKLSRCPYQTYTLRRFQHSYRTHILISLEYQALGMMMMETDHQSLVRYIPPHAEHRFLEIRPSTIGPAAGAGLFVKPGRKIPQGCVFCEYRGRSLNRAPPCDGVYVVHVRLTGQYIDGVSRDGTHLSLATFINDNGPEQMNAGMMEYHRHAGRVFLVAARDLNPEEEIFVLYGSNYWGFASYELLQESFCKPCPENGSRHNRKRVRENEIGNAIYSCKSCGENVLSRAWQLHAPHCGDSLVRRPLLHLSCMPLSPFTFVSSHDQISAARRHRAQMVSMSMVKYTDPQTFAHTYEDVVRDREFLFQDVAEEIKKEEKQNE